jgi:transposase
MNHVRVQPLADALRKEVLAHAVLHADETQVQVIKPPRQARTHFPAGLQRYLAG